MKASSGGAKVDVLGNSIKMELQILILDQRSRSFAQQYRKFKEAVMDVIRNQF